MSLLYVGKIKIGTSTFDMAEMEDGMLLVKKEKKRQHELKLHKDDVYKGYDAYLKREEEAKRDTMLTRKEIKIRLKNSLEDKARLQTRSGGGGGSGTDGIDTTCTGYSTNEVDPVSNLHGSPSGRRTPRKATSLHRLTRRPHFGK
jgi:hypothetical protein